MGRRGRRNRSDEEDDDQFEREYMRKRFKTGTANRDTQNVQQSAKFKEVNNDQVTEKSSPQAENNAKRIKASNETQPTTSSTLNNKIDEQTEVERVRLKNQFRKQRRKEKKAATAKAQQNLENNRKKDAAKLERVKAAQQKEREKLRKTPREFVTCRKGVKYADISVGKGPVVQDRKKVRVKYTLRAETKQGKILDSGSNFGFRLGKGEVIEGWDIGVKGMRQGGTRHLIVPPAAGYGNKNIGAGSGALLYFEITLLTC
mmetsp:Transcript_25723/g.36297  ORF Transcript_25723/g.36297 Transcript_25723/m.36297 type:complete len:259 (-) Transcript_25723:12-788(-)